MEFGEVAMAPPSLTAKPRKADTSNTGKVQIVVLVVMVTWCDACTHLSLVLITNKAMTNLLFFPLWTNLYFVINLIWIKFMLKPGGK